MTMGRIDTCIRVPTGGWDVAWTDGNGGPLTANVAAGDYLGPAALAAALQTAIRALAGTVGDGATVTVDDGEGTATGRVTIAPGSGTASLTWTDTDLRDALGFTANVSSSASATGAGAARGMWLPGDHKSSPYGDGAAGSLQTNFRATEGPNGSVYAVYGSGYRRHVGIRWDMVTAARALAHFESIANESFESFFLDVVTGRVSWIPRNPLVRLIWDADNDASYAEGRLVWDEKFDLPQVVNGWVGMFTVELPPLVVQGS